MNKSFSIPPEHYARELLHTMKIDDIPIPIEEIAASLGIEIHYSDHMDAEAFLLRSGDKAIIAINTNGRYYSRKKFSIAHELGHYCIPEHKEEYRCSIQDLYNYSSDKLSEKQANEFASELLMPMKAFSKDIKATSLNFADIKRLSDKYETSITDTAIRYIKNTDEPGIIIGCKDSRISWWVPSKSCSFYPKTGLLHEYTYAYDYFHKGTELKGTLIKVRPDAWLENARTLDDIYEETISMPILNQTISIIRPVIENQYMEDDDYDDWD